MAFFDVDGVLTDGGLLFSESGETLKRFHTLDGHGIKLLQKAGITPAVITGRDSAPLRVRLKALGVEHAVFGTEDKRPAAEQVLATLGLNWSQAAAMGDDWPDLPVMRRSALACARTTPTSKYATARTTPPRRAAVKAQRANSAICCWWPPGPMQACLQGTPHDALGSTRVGTPVAVPACAADGPARAGNVVVGAQRPRAAGRFAVCDCTPTSPTIR